MRGAGLAGLAVLLAGVAFAFVGPGHTADAPPPAPNNPLRAARIDACVRPTRPRGIPAFTADGTRLPFLVAPGQEPGTRPRCRPGELRILRLQRLTIAGQPAYVRRGGCQQPCLVRQPTVHVLGRDLSRPVVLLPPAVLDGDGTPVASCPVAVRAAPARAGADLGQMYYKTPPELRSTLQRTGDTGYGARWSNYGDPARRFRAPGGPAVDYSYLLWNLPRRRSGALLPGGGIVEALVEQGQPLALCTAPTLTLPSFDLGGRRNGNVVFAYARAQAAQPIYGWLLVGYRYRGRALRPLTTP